LHTSSRHGSPASCSDSIHIFSDLNDNSSYTLIRIDPVSMFVGVGYTNQFICAGLSRQSFEASLYSCFRTNDGLTQSTLHGFSFPAAPKRLHGIHRRQQFYRLASDEAKKALL
jgi:hypothetical protein